MGISRRGFLRAAAGGAALSVMRGKGEAAQPPNIVVILADDLGFGDLGCYGSKILTPNLDRMGGEGVLFRQFYAASPVCSASRAGLLTGRYGVRGGVPGVFFPSDKAGLSVSETTLADMLKSSGYKTYCVGKWHLGTEPQYLPTARGFDDYYGIPYSNDQFPSVLMQGTSVIESPVNLNTITQRYTKQAVGFIQQNKDAPFFLYMAHTAPHVPLAASKEFRGKSPLGLYGDVVEEMDWSVGQVLSALADLGLDSNTFVMFSSDNGPFFQGSPGKLRGRKGETFEGGIREPFIARFPGRIPAGKRAPSFGTLLDLLPTVAGLTGSALPKNPLDGVDIWPMMTGEAEGVDRPAFLYFNDWNLQCARLGRWKLHMSRYNGPAFIPPLVQGRMNLRLLNPELYDLETDPGESYSAAGENAGIVADIRAKVESLLHGMPDQVRSAWMDTQNRPVAPNGLGEWPVPVTPGN
ncbi:MAG: sulfatase [Bryobacterales bacterium]|nr:sulfatase [Bryobacterales bacterium]